MARENGTGRRSLLLFCARLAVSGGLLAWLLVRADAGAVSATLVRAHAGWAAAALALYGAMVALSVWRWRVLLRVQGTDLRPWTLAESFLVATFFNNFLPSNIGGDVVRIADTAPYTGSKTLAATVVLVDRFLGLVALLLMAALGALVAARHGGDLPGAHWLWVPPAVALAALVPALRAPRQVVQLGAPIERWGGAWARERLARLAVACERFGRAPRPLVWTTVGALAVQACLVGFFLCTARSLGIPLPLTTAACVVPLTLAAQMVPVSINGFGVREAVFAFFFTRLGLGSTAAVSLSLAGAGLILLFSLSGGALFLLRQFRG